VFKTRDFKIETISKPSKDSLIYGEKPKEWCYWKFYYLVKLPP
jgi:hypothetical protein